MFLADYATGMGIFMRTLGDVCRILGAEWTQRHCSTFIDTNAAAVWKQRDATTHQLSFHWNPAVPGEPCVVTGKSVDLCDLIMQAAGLDALSLAVRYAPAGEIDVV